MRTARKLAALLLSLIALPAAADEARVPALEGNKCVPTGQLRGDADSGRELHLEHCVACHGLTGKADVVVMHMDETPRDQSDPAVMSGLTDGYLYLAICQGGAAVGRSVIMSPWGDFFTDEEIKDLVAWIRTFSDT